MRRSIPLIVLAFASLSGCSGSMPNLWPFGGEAAERSRAPANATAYKCDGGRALYVRMLEGGAAAWVILPERELRLEKSGSAGTSYNYRGTTLEIKGAEATLFEGSSAIYSGCKAAAG